MKDFANAGINKFRITSGPMASSDSDGNYGAFFIPINGSRRLAAVVVASDADVVDWEHVSVHIKYRNKKNKIVERTPGWNEMCVIKRMFWSDDETVFQFHPERIEYVNINPHCLHMWKKKGANTELPPAFLV